MAIPKPVDFYLGVPLYAPVEYEGDETWNVLDVLYFNGTYDSFCIKCRRESTFKVNAPERPVAHKRDHALEQSLKQRGVKPQPPRLESSVFTVKSSCTRQELHKQDFIFFIDHQITHDESGSASVKSTFQKIGQQPSYGDLHMLQVKKYVHVLDKQQLGELTRAVGLASHDVGVGSYVYLRRIFETLVEEAHVAARADANWDEEAYARSRMNEKVAALKAHLPAFLVEHPGMYSLLSKGIHELSEQDCLKHFSTLRLGIELILDERLEARERANKIAAAKAAIQKAVGDAGA